MKHSKENLLRRRLSFFLSIIMLVTCISFLPVVSQAEASDGSKDLTFIEEPDLTDVLAQTDMTDIRLMLDGTLVNCDTSPKLVASTGRTLIPVRALFEQAGGTVGWDGTNQIVTVSYNSHTVKLRINSTQASVDGVTKTLDQAAMILTGNRTYIPLRFVAENLGFTVNWDAENRISKVTSPGKSAVTGNKITAVSVSYGENSSAKITVTSSAAMTTASYKTTALSGPDRYVFDFPGISGSAGKYGIDTSGQYLISGVRTAMFTETDFRLVVDLNSSVSPSTTLSSDGKTLTITFGSYSAKPVSAYNPYSDGKLVVILDPGHGESTSGKRSPDGTLREYYFNRQVAYKLKSILESKGVTVYLTVPDATTDTSLADRCTKANNSDADIYVSIHANAAGNGSDWYNASGWELYYYELSENSKKLANAIHDANKGRLGIKDRGIIANNTLYVLRHTNMPAVLIEHGFFDNKTEVELLKTDAFRQKCAELDAEGIMNYFYSFK